MKPSVAGRVMKVGLIIGYVTGFASGVGVGVLIWG